MSTKLNTTTTKPVDCLASIYDAHRDLVKDIRRTVMAEETLSVDQADSLVFLYGLEVLDWGDFKPDSEGYFSVTTLKEKLLHSPATLGRRIKEHRKAGYITVKEPNTPRSNDRTYIQAVRLTAKGKAKAKAIWAKYEERANYLLKGVSPKDLATHRRVNETITNALAARKNDA